MVIMVNNWNNVVKTIPQISIFVDAIKFHSQMGGL